MTKIRNKTDAQTCKYNEENSRYEDCGLYIGLILDILDEQQIREYHYEHHNNHYYDKYTPSFLSIYINKLYCSYPCDNGNIFLNELQKENGASARSYKLCESINSNYMQCGLLIPTGTDSKKLIQTRIAHKRHHDDEHLLLVEHHQTPHYFITDEGECSERCIGPQSNIKKFGSVDFLDECSVRTSNKDITMFKCGFIFPAHMSDDNYYYYNAQHKHHHQAGHIDQQYIVPTENSRQCMCAGAIKPVNLDRQLML